MWRSGARLETFKLRPPLVQPLALLLVVVAVRMWTRVCWGRGGSRSADACVGHNGSKKLVGAWRYSQPGVGVGGIGDPRVNPMPPADI
jgi:hypothetical protein